MDKTEQEKRLGIGTITLPVRFFMYAMIDGDIDIVECTENEFLEADGTIDYERNSLHWNGVAQICLTKNNL